MHHIFIDKSEIDLDNKFVDIDCISDYENYNHLVNSLRIKEGEFVLCSVIPFISSFDYRTRVSSIDKNKVSLSIEEETKANELDIEINLYQGLCKSDKFEFIIEKAVELGVHKIIPLDTEYTIVKFEQNEKKLISKLDRFNKIAKSAAEQSKRHYIPEVSKPLKLSDIKINDVANAYNILFYENANCIEKTKNYIDSIKCQEHKESSLFKQNANQISDYSYHKIINVFIGPEGGFSDKEITEVKKMGFNILSLGKRILRTETAAVTALSILMYEFEKDEISKI